MIWWPYGHQITTISNKNQRHITCMVTKLGVPKMDVLSICLGVNPATAMTKDGKVLGINRGTNPRLDFPASGYVVKAVKEVNDQALFGLVNMWLDSLTTEEKDTIYDMYCRGKNVIIETTKYETVNAKLVGIFNNVSHLLNVDRVAAWLERLPGDPAAYKHTLEAYPEDEVPVDDYVEGDAVEEVVHRPGTPTKTLLRSEVRDLIAVAIVSKLMAPLLCEYINKFKMVFQRMLEMQLFNIMSQVHMFHHAIINRLYHYVRAFILDTEVREQLGVVIHSYMSEEEYVDYVVTMIVCNRLMNAPLQPGDGKKTFVPNVISSAVRDACNPAVLFNEKRQRAKTDEQKGPTEDNAKRSMFERISVGFTLSVGQQAMSNWGVQRFLERELTDTHTHKRLTQYDRKLVEYFTSQDRSDITNQTPQKTLCSLVVNEFFPRTMFDLQSKKDMDLLYVVSAIWLYQNGYKELAALQTARGAVDETYLCGTTIRQWSDADMTALHQLYPSRPATSIGRPIMANLGMTMIDLLLKDFITLRWSSGEGTGETIEPPNQFRTQIVEIIQKRGI